MFLLAASLLVLEPAAGKSTKKKARKRARTPAPVVAVTPGLEIEKQIVAEVAKAQNILDELGPGNAVDSPYLISAIYYHDGLLDGFPEDRAVADPADRVISQITRTLTANRKRAYIDLLRTVCSIHRPEACAGHALPVPYSEPTRRRWRQRNHKNAIDVFVPEGSPVYAAAGGMVLLAEGGWKTDEPFSTSSLRGGNAVIVFNPSENRFYRYCHLEKVTVEPGAMVEAGRQIGTVGHTGFNASRPGHGGHLHFEINEYDGRAVHALDDKQLRAWLRAAAAQ